MTCNTKYIVTLITINAVWSDIIGANLSSFGKRYKSADKAKQKWFRVKSRNFGYHSQDKVYILDRHDKTLVRKFIKIKPNYSVYNGDLIYFAKRLSQENPRIKTLRNLFRKQSYKCPVCSEYLLPGEIIELYHYLDRQNKRTGEIAFVHGHCHDQIHSNRKSIN
jgi:RNA-directed DNA polymerase